MKHENQEKQKPGHDAIALAAYLIWEQRGRPQGSDIECWLEAERQIAIQAGVQRVLNPAGTPARAISPPPAGGSAPKSKKSPASGDGKFDGKIAAGDERRAARPLERA